MPVDIPSVGINQFDVFDPNDVNIEPQAYPRPLQPAQALPLALDIAGSLFAGPFTPNPSQGLPAPDEIDVNAQSFVFPTSLGVATPTKAEVDLMLQISTIQPVRSFLVTDSGNFDLDNDDNEAEQAFTITSIVDAQTGAAPGVSTTVYRAILSPAPLGFGLPFAGRELVVTTSVTAGNVGQSRFIALQNGNSISFRRTEGNQTFATNLAVGAVVTIDMKREGFEVFFDRLSAPVDVFILNDTDPVEQDDVTATFENFDGDFFPGNGAPPAFTPSPAQALGPTIEAFPNNTSPAIGGGNPIPLLLFANLRETAFFPASQSSVVGLPVNVNVG